MLPAGLGSDPREAVGWRWLLFGSPRDVWLTSRAKICDANIHVPVPMAASTRRGELRCAARRGRLGNPRGLRPR